MKIYELWRDDTLIVASKNEDYVLKFKIALKGRYPTVRTYIKTTKKEK